MPKFSFPDTVTEQSEPEEPFSLDDPPRTFEDWLNEIQTLEDMLLADENERLLADSDYDNYEEI